MYDLIIKNGKIIDGTGSPSYFSDVAVKDGKIVKIGTGLSDAAKTIDATGLCVVPGFIDSHSHSDHQVFSRPDMDVKAEQGITVSIGGQCGGSDFPLSKTAKREEYKDYEEFGNEYDLKKDADKYYDVIKKRRLGSRLVMLTGHGTIRRAVMGVENRAPTPEELEKMKAILRKCLSRGSLGLSFGLYYAPGSYASTEECVEMAKVVSEFGGVIAAHIRDEAEDFAKAAKEFISIVRQAKVRGVMSHHKAAGSMENWGKVTHTLRMIDEANAEGLEVYCDVYPYVASSTSLAATFLPNKELARGNDALIKLLDDPAYRAEMHKWNEDFWGTDYSWVKVTSCEALPQYKGLFVPEIAKMHGKDEIDTILDIMKECRMDGNACYFTMCEEDLMTVLAHPRAMIGTDGSIPSPDAKSYHPRSRGTFPRVLGRYVRERGVTTLPEMIRKMTSMPARVYGLKTKGLIWENMDADICIFDENKIIDRADFNDCHARAEGLSYVIINGEVVAENAVYNGKREAKVILFEDR